MIDIIIHAFEDYLSGQYGKDTLEGSKNKHRQKLIVLK